MFIRVPLRGLALATGLTVVCCGWNAAQMVIEDTNTSKKVMSQLESSHLMQEKRDRLSKRKLLRRALWLLWSFSLALLLSPGALLSEAFRERVYYRLLYQAILYSRSAAFIKWSQWASIRLDLFPVALCLLLSQFQTNGPIHSVAHTIAELEAAGVSWVPSGEEPVEMVAAAGAAVDGSEQLQQLTDLAETPLASGSIAQVHLARMGAEKVVVKVRHPRVHEELLLDIELLRRAALAIHSCVPALRWVNAPGTVAQFEATMSGQCDLEQEAHHLEAFRFNFKRKASWLVWPKVFFASPGVLIESFEAGENGKDIVQRGRLGDRAEGHFVLARGEDVYLQMLLIDNFMHADLHPGNMLLRRGDPSDPFGKPQLILLDAGMACVLSGDERRNFIGLVQAMGNGDGVAMAENVLRFSSKRSCNEEAFTADIQAMCAEKCRGYGTGMDVGEVVRAMMQAMYRHCVPIDGNYATLVANMLCLEGMARAVEPNFSVIDVAYPLLRSHELLGDERFQRVFFCAHRVLPLCVWESLHKGAIYAALNGQWLRQFAV